MHLLQHHHDSLVAVNAIYRLLWLLRDDLQFT